MNKFYYVRVLSARFGWTYIDSKIFCAMLTSLMYLTLFSIDSGDFKFFVPRPNFSDNAFTLECYHLLLHDTMCEITCICYSNKHRTWNVHKRTCIKKLAKS